MMGDVLSVKDLAAAPFYGAFFTLRRLDPLYQAEIGIEREWEIRAWDSVHDCNCKYCGFSGEKKMLYVTAKTVAAAIAEAKQDLPRGWHIDGIRPRGSRSDYADVDQ